MRNLFKLSSSFAFAFLQINVQQDVILALSSGMATTTRYWDCSGGACGCSYVPTGLNNPADPAHCHSNAMFRAPAGNSFGAKFYGAAAISSTLGGGDWMADGCGKCWKVTGTSNTPGYEGVSTTLVLKGTNFCPDGNTMCGAGAHFDIAAPGFDVLQYSFANTCAERQADEIEGFESCGYWMINEQNPDANCDCSLFKSSVLRDGCENFLSLQWDNPEVAYEEVVCPDELADLHCGYPYPDEDSMPDTCAENYGYLNEGDGSDDGNVDSDDNDSNPNDDSSSSGDNDTDNSEDDSICDDCNRTKFLRNVITNYPNIFD